MAGAHCGHCDGRIEMTTADVGCYIYCRECYTQVLQTLVLHGLIASLQTGASQLICVTTERYPALPATAKLRPFAQAAYSEGEELL